ncbi:hypothetical protein MKS88_005142 [Plasmodium brasilianum]|uniref:Uncharacterized protein n=2 Tax=Plasmodium (Plasmodium) TaxID=418103 RepID=A0A1D3TDI1_PLAMA|nr:conserved Plasmodium protein, unknown function [Plasmodium malariae]KAI4835924.1 hypothetical protein MKS88_005142 [Plasmodium brasilianum]SCP02861.1 conserved Plasmodium protein, unknown function [Plasmodium malariae]
MKRYNIHNSKLYNPKKVKVECEYENELRKKDYSSSSIFDYNLSHLKRIEDIEERNLERLSFFHLEENRKRRKINFLNIFDHLKNSSKDTKKTGDGCDEVGDDSCHNNGDSNRKHNTTNIPYQSKNERTKKSKAASLNSNNPINNEYNNNSKEKLNKGNLVDDWKIEENMGNKKGIDIKNKYYEKINNILKEAHMSKIARKTNRNGCKYLCAR